MPDVGRWSWAEYCDLLALMDADDGEVDALEIRDRRRPPPNLARSDASSRAQSRRFARARGEVDDSS